MEMDMLRAAVCPPKAGEFLAAISEGGTSGSGRGEGLGIPLYIMGNETAHGLHGLWHYLRYAVRSQAGKMELMAAKRITQKTGASHAEQCRLIPLPC